MWEIPIYAFLGYIWELLIIGKESVICGDSLNKYFSQCLPFLWIYGLGGWMINFIDEKIESSLISFIATVISVIILECMIGKISLIWNKFRTWDYRGSSHFSFCDGYVSVESIIVWSIMILAIRYFRINKKLVV